MKNVMQRLGHPLFIFSLALLLLNDFLLKSEFPGLLTGKLSDFAGLFAFPYFFSAFFPRHLRSIHVATTIGFIFWKSAAATPLLLFLQEIGLPFYRVIDPTDLVALTSIPLSFIVLQKPAPRFQLKPLITHAIILTSAFAFIATSAIRVTSTVHTYNTEYRFDCSKSEFLIRLNGLQLQRANRANRNVELIDFDAESDLVLIRWGREPVAQLFDTRRFRITDTLRLFFPETKAIITDTTDGVTVKLLSIVRHSHRRFKMRGSAKSQWEFERKIVRKLRRP
ncbi:MAG: hypothetical protein AAF570_03050 [Bacteroidota bacterium]